MNDPTQPATLDDVVAAVDRLERTMRVSLLVQAHLSMIWRSSPEQRTTLQNLLDEVAATELGSNPPE
jgi:hypothetical protein